MLEFLDRIFPGTDSEIAREAHGLLQKQGIEFRLGSRVTSARVQGDKCVVECEGAAPLECDRVLVAVGRVPYTEGLGLESVGIELDAKGRIPVNDHFETSAAGIFAIGDCIQGPMLAHKAEEEGVACVERIVTGYGHVNYDAIPAVIFTQPEIAAVGKTEDQLQAEKVAYRKGIFPFRANGRAALSGKSTARSRSCPMHKPTASSASTSSAPARAISSPKPPPPSPLAPAPKTSPAPATPTPHSPRPSKKQPSRSTGERSTYESATDG